MRQILEKEDKFFSGEKILKNIFFKKIKRNKAVILL